jgi:hypothetical protein
MRRGRFSLEALAVAALVGAAGAGGAGFGAVGCLPGRGPELIGGIDAEAPPPTNLGDDGGAARADVDLGDPFAVIGLAPSHGPWTGGTRAKVSGRGFSSKLRVWIGGTELAPSAIFASDPTRAAIEIPPGAAGPADVKIRDDATAEERVLVAGYLYDAFVVAPDSGATSGGTRVTLTGSGTAWTAATTVTIGGAPCAGMTVRDETHAECLTPPGAQGAKDVVVTTPGGPGSAAPDVSQARDAFTYSDSPDGFRGGLAGGALAGALRVLAFDAWTGTAIESAYAIAGGSLATALVKKTDASGIAQLSDPALAGKVTVTVAAKCHQPITFVDVPVDTVTAYLTPTLDLSCASGDPPSTGGGGGRALATVEGELVWPGLELKVGAWTVPPPVRPTERRAAYVFVAGGSPFDAFVLPPQDQAAVPERPGTHGYPYSVASVGGNVTLYALAGIEDRSVSPPRFEAYAMGIARGVAAPPGVKTTAIDIPMTTAMDHVLALSPSPPARGPRGPDRFVARAAARLGPGAFAILPNAASTSLLPLQGDVSFTGVPALDGSLTGASYVVGASAVTGLSLGFPASFVTSLTTTDTNAPLAVGGFLPVPVLHEPGAGSWGGTRVSLDATGAVDLLSINVRSGGGLVTWTIIAPGGSTRFDLPDLGTLAGNVGLVHGAIDVVAYAARLDGLAYGKVRYGQLDPSAWNAYAGDAASGAY